MFHNTQRRGHLQAKEARFLCVEKSSNPPYTLKTRIVHKNFHFWALKPKSSNLSNLANLVRTNYPNTPYTSYRSCSNTRASSVTSLSPFSKLKNSHLTSLKQYNNSKSKHKFQFQGKFSWLWTLYTSITSGSFVKIKCR